jgi:hypothetical protein
MHRRTVLKAMGLAMLGGCSHLSPSGQVAKSDGYPIYFIESGTAGGRPIWRLQLNALSPKWLATRAT